MEDWDRSKEDLINELNQLRKRNLELELYLKEKTNINASSPIIVHERSRLEAILDAIPSSIVLVDAADGKFLYVNKRGMEIYGFDYVGFDLGAHVAKANVLKPDGTPYPLEDTPASNSLKYGKVVHNVELTIENANGIRIPVLVSSSPLYDSNGAITHAVVNFEDISELKRVEEEQKKLLKEIDEQRGLLQSIIESLPVGLWIADANGQMLQINDIACQIWGGIAPYPKSVQEYQIYSARWADTGEKILPEDMPMAHALRGETIKEAAVDFERFDGTHGTQLVSAAPIRGLKGGILGCVAIVQDITERRQSEELRMTNKALEKTIEMKDEFLSLLSHEFRTPISVISTAIQALNSIYADEMTEKVKEYIGTIRQNNFRQLRLVNNLLDITRANEGRIKINKKNIDIVLLTKCITESVYQYASQKGIRLTFVSSFQKRIIGIDDEKYERILLNLLSNAIKFTPEGKIIAVNLRTCKGNICVEVKDNGIGIPPDKIDMIFEKFGQVDSSLSRQAEGTGIGLSLVKKFVEVLGGTITVKSKVGKGSTFTVMLPGETILEEHDEIAMTDSMNNRLIQTINVEFSDIYL